MLNITQIIIIFIISLTFILIAFQLMAMKKKTTNDAIVVAQNSLLNALIREWKEWSFVIEPEENKECILLKLPTLNLELLLPLSYKSDFHLHNFQEPLFARFEQNNWFHANYLMICNWISQEPLLGSFLSKWSTQQPYSYHAKFQERVANSLACITESIEHYKPPIEHTFLSSEQSLIFGHSAHPYPKFREGFSLVESYAYLPEFQAKFSLCYIAVSAELLWSNNDSKMDELRNSVIFLESNILALCPRGFHAFPMHPWQWGKLIQLPIIQQHIFNNKIKWLGMGEKEWFPTTSVRAIYNPDTPYMLKFSLSTKLTNSIRVLKSSEVSRGYWLHKAFQSQLGQKLLREAKTLRILYEPVGFAIKDNNDLPIPETFALLRDNPFNSNSKVFSIASIAQEGIKSNPSLLVNLVHQLANAKNFSLQESAENWWKTFLCRAIKPFLIALTKYGFVFSAHQQNMLVETEHGLPTTVYFRDCQGTAFSKKTIQNLSKEIPGFPQKSDLGLSTEDVNVLAAYYLFVNNVFALANALVRESLLDREHTLLILRRFLQNLDTKNSEFISFLLKSTFLYSKGNLVLGLLDINETQFPEASFSSYTKITNPLCDEEFASDFT